MSNRYVTEKEKEGSLRRMAAYRARLAELGIKNRYLATTEFEYAKLKEILAVWRGDASHLGADRIAEILSVLPNPSEVDSKV